MCKFLRFLLNIQIGPFFYKYYNLLNKPKQPRVALIYRASACLQTHLYRGKTNEHIKFVFSLQHAPML